MHQLHRLENSILNTPHLCTPEVLESCLSYLSQRNAGEFELSTSKIGFTPTSKQLDYNPTTKVGRLSINGALTYKSTVLSALCGMTSYEGLQADFKQLVDQGAKRIIFDVSSGGGEASHCFETASLLREIADKSGIKLISYIDTIGASAAYALSCIADEVIVNPDAIVGSIGCVVKLTNSNKALNAAGIEETFLFGGRDKIPYAADGSFSKTFLSDLQGKIDHLYSQFVGFVAEHRNLPIKNVISTDAKTFMAKEALELGLADKVLTVAQLESYLNTSSKPATVKTPQASLAAPAKAKASTPDAPKGYVRNNVTGTLHAVKQSTANLPEVKRQSRLKRLKAFDDETATHLMNVTHNFSDEKFELTIKTFEENNK